MYDPYLKRIIKEKKKKRVLFSNISNHNAEDILNDAFLIYNQRCWIIIHNLKRKIIFKKKNPI